MIQTYKTTLLKKTQLTHDVYLLDFKLVEPTEIQFVAGQYLMFLCPQPDGTNLRRLYSIASAPVKKDQFQLIAEIVPNGVASTLFLKMNVGDEAQFQGPAGMFTLRRNNHRVFLATGTGLAPMISILHDITSGTAQSEHTNFLFWGLQYYKDLYFLNELKDLVSRHPSLEVKICLSREESLDAIPEEDKKFFSLGRVTVGLDDRINSSEVTTDFDFYLCGGRTVIESLRQYLYEKNIPKEQVIFEKF